MRERTIKDKPGKVSRRGLLAGRSRIKCPSSLCRDNQASK